MKKRLLLLLFLFSAFWSCDTYISPIDRLNHHLISQLGYEFVTKEGVYSIAEANTPYNSTTLKELNKWLPELLSPSLDYTYLYNEDGTLYSSYRTDKKEYTLRYEYGKLKQLYSIAGYYVDYEKEIFEYYPDGYIKYIYRENADNVFYKFSEDFKTVQLVKFRPIRDGSKRAIRSEGLLGKMHLKNYESGNFVIEIVDENDKNKIEKFTYQGLNLVKKELNNGSIVNYEFDKYDNVTATIISSSEGKPLKYTIEYYYDNNNNWIDRRIINDTTLVLHTEREIKYYK